ncbi:DMT family transporter [Sphingomonas sp. NSE70-1]|uniref:DMT family transporter n=1 Tax=Sphingomonas caseinilyticus TaxID=2908205 RepID=A0ABT0RV75_9SPHN|nr:DMT family transporter [Sphingomonas caseinilyticus]MCL6698944.1 DMT family transporter [Sphingomonas caseinilyticus]
MATLSEDCFDRKAQDATREEAGYSPPMINQQMIGREWGILLFLAVIWGGAFMFIGVAVRHVEPLTYVWLRLTIAAAAMFLFLKLKGQKLDLPREVWGSILLLALLNNALPFTLFGWGQTHIASGLASILNATTPIWGVLVAHFFTQDERMTPRKIAGVLLGFAGVATMIGPMLLANVGTDALAQLACIAAALSYAFAAVWARRFRRMGVSPMSVTTGQLTSGALMMLPLALLIDQPWTQPMPPITAWGAIVALALLCTAFGYVLYFRLIETAGATNALLVTLLVPPFAIFFGSLFLGEVLAPQDFIGLALIALGLAAIDGRILRLLGPRSARQAA